MEGLNKKPSYYLQQIIAKLNDKKLESLIVLTVFLAYLRQISFISSKITAIPVLILFASALYSKLLEKTIISTIIIAVIYFEGLSGLGAYILIILFSMMLYKAPEKIVGEKQNLYLLANTAHLGDALTTYIGLKKGLTEQNPFVLPLLEAFGTKSIFAVKASVLVVTTYIYFADLENYDSLMKVVFLTGLYLTAGNAVNLF